MQLNEEIDFKVFVDDSIQNSEAIFLPGMLIQPFVENAILHGLGPKIGSKKLEIEYSYQEGYLMVNVRDNGIGRQASEELQKQRKHIYKSWSTSIVNDRVKILNLEAKDNIKIEIQDINNNGEKGTLVLLIFKLS